MHRYFSVMKFTIAMLMMVSVDGLASPFSQVDVLIKQAKYQQALQLVESQCRDEQNISSLMFATCLGLRGQILLELADYRKPEALFKQALSIRKNLLANNHVDVAASLNDLGELYRHRGEYEKPEALYQRALSIRLTQFGESHPETAEIYKNLGELYHDQGNYRKADKFYRKATDILKAAIDKNKNTENELALAEVLNWQGMLYQEQDMLVEAELFYQRSLDYRFSILGEKHPDTLDSLTGLTSLYLEKGDYDLSLNLAREIEATLESIGYSEHPNYAYVAGILAEIYSYYNLPEKSEQYYKSILAIYQRVYGENNIMTAYSYTDLGWMSIKKKDYEQAKGYFKKALSIRINTLSPHHQEVASSKSNLARVAMKQGDLVTAEKLMREALAIYDMSLGAESIAKANVLYNLSVLKLQQGKIKAAIDLMSQAEKNQELEIQRYLSTGSERQKIAYMNTLREVTDYTISLHLQADSKNADAARLALKTILRRKGRVIDVLTENSIRKLLPKFPVEVQKQVVNWQRAKQQLATLSIRKPVSLSKDDYFKTLSDLRYKVDVMSSIIETFRNLIVEFNSQTVEINNVANLIPVDSLLVEYIIYQPFKVSASSGRHVWGKKRLAAYTMDNKGNIKSVDLGEVARIKNSFNIARRKLSTPLGSIASVKRSLHKLDRLIFKPVLPLLGNTKKIFIAPDGFLNLLPFSVLIDDGEQYRGDRFRFSYLTSGRDLLAMPLSTKQKSASNSVLIIANPDFDSIKANSNKINKSELLTGIRSGDFNEMHFEALPYTEEEALALKKIMPDARLLLAEAASEARLKTEKSAYILHIATHGFFNSDTSNGWSISSNPLLNSGIALSGANKKNIANTEDGILTALEITEIDLSNTELVVLSACETGVGVVENGQGLYGLRRALVLAGSASQLLSLWKVSDKVTKEVMSNYYRNLFSAARQGRAEAIQNTRISIRKKYPHPFYWSSFIVSGDWRVL